MTKIRTAPYGTWKSPIIADILVSQTVRLSTTSVDGDCLYWLELRSAEGGRTVLVRRTSQGKITDLTPEPFNVRSRVHEYGGAAYMVAEGTVFFSNFSDQRIYRLDNENQPRPITPEIPFRYADYEFDKIRNRIICVGEDHSDKSREPKNLLMIIDPEGNDKPGVLSAGKDFYSNPRLSPDSTRLAWLTWNHPNLPWDGTELWVADILADGSLDEPELVAGGKDESICHPIWSPDGNLHFISDRSGWYNLYRLNDGRTESLCPMEAEFASPQWVFGEQYYLFESNDSIICTYSQSGIWRLARLNLSTGKMTTFPTGFDPTCGGYLCRLGDKIVFVGDSATQPTAIVACGAGGENETILRRSGSDFDPGYFSIPQPIEFPTANDKTAHAFYYPPQNKDFVAGLDEKPPLIVKSHGGPTAATSNSLSLEIQFWTSRGFGVVDVNYGGSSGYGRRYRRRLNGQWGVVDVEDCANAARYLVEQDMVDGDRLIIRGGSAGGYTTLCALTFLDLFKAGCSRYGIGDLETLAQDTHKFESRYGDSLIGPYPEESELYRQRSPINFVDRLNSPVIFFQGLEDRVVPPSQTEKMVEALKRKKLPVAYIAFEGEQHGFRKAQNIKRSLEAELYFYSRIFGFDPADQIDPVQIDNL